MSAEELKIRVKPTIAACECGWFVNTLDADSAYLAAGRHNREVHAYGAVIYGEETVQEVQTNEPSN